MTNKFIEQRVEALENELSELKLIVAQIRKPSTVVEEALANDIIEFEGKQYKKVDREAREGDVVVIKRTSKPEWLTVGKPYKTYECPMDGTLEFKGKKGAVTVYGGYQSKHTIDDVDVYELTEGYNPGIVMVDETPIKTANQLRAEIIEKAKGFVEKYLNACRSMFITHEGNGLLSDWDMSPKFEVNPKKRAVVALLYRTNGGALVGKGIAKCDPSDVFNEHIGKAIALGRALGLDVSEFEQAVQPTEKVVGMDVVYNADGRVYDVRLMEKNTRCLYSKGTAAIGSYVSNCSKVVNDTHAQYEVNK